MTENNDMRKYCKFTERFCSEIGENVMLRSTSPDNDSYECLNSPFCKAGKNCARCRRGNSGIL